MVKINDVAFNASYVATVTNDKLNNQSIIGLGDGRILAIPHDEMSYNKLVDTIDWEQSRYFE